MSGTSVSAWQCASEADLVAAAQSGDQLAIEYLVLHHPPVRAVIGKLKRQYDRDGRLRDDLEGDACLAVIEALRTFDPTRGARFGTYAFYGVRSAMLKTAFPRSEYRHADDGPQRVTTVPTHEELDEDSPGTDWEASAMAADPSYGIDPAFEDLEAREREAGVHRFVATLEPAQSEVVHAIYWDDETHASVAARRGVSRPAISQTLNRVHERGRTYLSSSAAA